MRIIALYLFLSMLLMTASGVTARTVVLVQESPPLPATDYFPEKWNEYTSEQGRFRIRFPGKPKEQLSSAGVYFLTYSGLLEYRVSYEDEPELSGTPESAKRYLEEMNAASVAIAKIGNERIVKLQAVTVDGYPAYFTHVESSKGWVRSQQVVVGKRVYTVTVEGRKGHASELEGKDDFEKVAMGFINSFKLILSSAKSNTGMQRTRLQQAS